MVRKSNNREYRSKYSNSPNYLDIVFKNNFKNEKKLINNFMAPSTQKEKKKNYYFWLLKRFFFDFFVPVFFAYGIYAFIAYMALRTSKKLVEAGLSGDFKEYDKRLKLSRQFEVVLHILRMVAYGGLLICSFLWLLGYKKPFQYFWPIQQVFLILTVVADLIMKWLAPTDPTSLILSATILLDYQGKRRTIKAAKENKEFSLTDNIVVKLMYSNILGAFVTVLATGKLWWDTKFKEDINIFLILGIIIIIGHCFLINLYGLMKSLKRLKDNKPTLQLINDTIDTMINKICDLLGLKKCLTQEQKNKFKNILYKFIQNYATQIKEGRGFGITSETLDGIDTDELEKLLFDLAVANGNAYVVTRINEIKLIASQYMEISQYMDKYNISDEDAQLIENTMNSLNTLYNNPNISQEEVDNIITNSNTIFDKLSEQYNFNLSSNETFTNNNSNGETFTDIEYSSLLNK